MAPSAMPRPRRRSTAERDAVVWTFPLRDTAATAPCGGDVAGTVAAASVSASRLPYDGRVLSGRAPRISSSPRQPAATA